MARFRDEDVRMALNICAAREGYSLRPLQEQVISFVQGSDVFMGLPTESGIGAKIPLHIPSDFKNLASLLPTL